MNEIEFIQELANAADEIRPPDVDLVEGVLCEIRQRETPGLGTLGVWVSGLSAAAAVLGLLGLQAWQSVSDPLNEMIALAQLVTT